MQRLGVDGGRERGREGEAAREKKRGKTESLERRSEIESAPGRGAVGETLCIGGRRFGIVFGGWCWGEGGREGWCLGGERDVLFVSYMS
jgi:hypothetical protein